MKYLFVGGSQDGNHLEIPDNQLSVQFEVRHNGQLLGYEVFTKQMISYAADRGACSIFAWNELNMSQLMWRLVSGYKATT